MRKAKSSSFKFTVSFREAAIFFSILLLDFLSKYWVVNHLPLIQPYLGFPYGGIGVLNTTLLKFSIVHMTNTGTAWGLLANFQIPLLIVRIVVTGAMLGYLLFFKPANYLRIPLFMIGAGAIGNILDYFLYGHVIDMFYFIFYKYSYPIFNIADSAIFCGIAYLVLFGKRDKNAH
ncbi:MAG: signal peptidase II [Verrucomicrobia bacterium]|nr:signal peptidase II [Verrucomicrobiota bacterium]